MTSNTHTPAPPAASWLARATAIAAMAILVMNVLLVAYDVLLRWLFGAPQSWVADIASMTYPVALAFCLPPALESGHMIAIRFLGQAIGPRTTGALDFIGNLLLSGMLALMAWKVSERAIHDWDAGYRTANIALPLAPTWGVVAALVVLAALFQFRLTWRAASDLRPGAAHA